MKKLYIFSVLGLALSLAGPVHASTFTLDSYTVSLNSTDPGLVVWEQDLLADPYSFPSTSLNNVGDTFTTTLFRLGTNETALNVDDVIPYSIDVNLSFSSPGSFAGDTYGITGAAWWGNSFGYVLWDNPLVLSFGTTGLLAISLSNATFGLPGYADISATFKLLQADQIVSTPEPSSLLLIGVGLFATTFVRRRFRTIS